mmetsp:Transcript_15162/g.29812  ORF Transcript_15162/g.29812 Transcript_15162/m.29812 type:complete len:328 (+) Transcript_15162:44-1027(+)|eukprot:CAMPEP_0175149012 /NCGR_PEP_ID=MMETSP0087-20121206/16976_1 /TAXON_ID=136419 /ORGANISM="Unknown Unknown, Strain D1" /LENGTH=327 /DNA_ID=CAMNT_0016434595 /DNA_START=11 /DNA_END=994 /DNA_ORIENTATION=+
MRVALIGAGRMGQLRAPILFANPKVSIGAVVDPLEVPGKALAEKFRTIWSSSFDSLDTSLLDAVVISTGTFNHKEMIKVAAEAKLAVFCEKPIHEDPDVIRELFAVCRDHGVPLCCGFQRRFDTSYRALRDAVADGVIGVPTLVRVMFADHPAPSIDFLKKGGCPFMDLAPHDLDFICWALDDHPIEVFASGSSSDPQLAGLGVLDTAAITLKFSKGVICNLMMSRGSVYGYDQRMEVFGTEGMVNLGNTPENHTIINNRNGSQHSGLHFSFPQHFRQAFESEMSTFVDYVDGTGSSWPINEESCVLAQRIAAKAAESARQGKALSF